jgi:hypothetical protein
MYLAVASIAHGDQVRLRIVTQQASRTNVVNLEIVWASAVLTPSSIALQDLPAKFAVGIRVQPKPGSSGSQRVHDAFRNSSKNSFFSG